MTVHWLARGEHHLAADSSWLSALEQARAASLPFAKRRREYLVARWTLKQAVATALGWDAVADLSRIEARHAPDGAPELYVDGAPAGLDVTLTDRAGWAVCLLAPHGVAPGVDLELVEPRTALFVEDYLTAAEQATVAAAQERWADGHDLAANLLWSAKESALKVLRTGLRRDTRSVEVAIADLAGADGAWSPLTVRSREGERFDGWWRRSGQFLLTTCTRVPQQPPVTLELPPALDDARPIHSWLAAPVTPPAG